jgi:hypothetical protein
VSDYSRGPWYVHLWVRGYYSGAYEHPDRESAEKDRDERRKNGKALGIHYQISRSINEPR